MSTIRYQFASVVQCWHFGLTDNKIKYFSHKRKLHPPSRQWMRVVCLQQLFVVMTFAISVNSSRQMTQFSRSSTLRVLAGGWSVVSSTSKKTIEIQRRILEKCCRESSLQRAPQIKSRLWMYHWWKHPSQQALRKTGSVESRLWQWWQEFPDIFCFIMTDHDSMTKTILRVMS